MSFFQKFAIAASVALTSTGAFANEAAENASVCISKRDDANWFKLPEGKEKETCSCVGNHSAWMKKSYPQLSTTDVIKKGYHACLSPSSISSYYYDVAHQTVAGSVSSSTAQNYASCMKTAGLIQGMRFANDSRTDRAAYTAANKDCQYLINVDGLKRIFE